MILESSVFYSLIYGLLIGGALTAFLLKPISLICGITGIFIVYFTTELLYYSPSMEMSRYIQPFSGEFLLYIIGFVGVIVLGIAMIIREANE